MKKTLLIDSDHLVYSIGFAADKNADPVRLATYSIDKQIEKIIAQTHVHQYKLYLTGKGNYRNEVATLAIYKGNRLNTPKPTHYQALRDHLVTVWKATVVDGMEADDAVGIAQTQGGGHTILVSVDKDLNQVPGEHYNYLKQIQYTVSEAEGLHNFYKQTLTGDRCDNIPGLHGYGEKKTEALLKDCFGKPEETYNRVILDAYTSAIKDDKIRMTLNVLADAKDRTDAQKILTELKILLWIRRE